MSRQLARLQSLWSLWTVRSSRSVICSMLAARKTPFSVSTSWLSTRPRYMYSLHTFTIISIQIIMYR